MIKKEETKLKEGRRRGEQKWTKNKEIMKDEKREKQHKLTTQHKQKSKQR